MDMKNSEELATYMSRIRHICNLLLAGGINLPSILLNVFAVNGLGNGYVPVKKEFSLASSLFTSLDLEGIKIKCATYTSAAAAIVDDPDTKLPRTERPPDPKTQRPSQLRRLYLPSLDPPPKVGKSRP